MRYLRSRSQANLPNTSRGPDRSGDRNADVVFYPVFLRFQQPVTHRRGC